MKKTIILFTLSIFLYSISYTQTKSKIASITLGEKNKGSQKTFQAGVIGTDEKGIYTIRGHMTKYKFQNEYNIEHYDFDMNLLNSSTLNIFYKKNIGI